MPGTFSQILLHIVFATRKRNLWLTPPVRGRVHEAPKEPTIVATGSRPFGASTRGYQPAAPSGRFPAIAPPGLGKHPPRSA